MEVCTHLFLSFWFEAQINRRTPKNTFWPRLHQNITISLSRIIVSGVAVGQQVALRHMSAMGCKRILIDSNYLHSLHRPNVNLIWDDISAITENGIKTVKGKSIN
jgi:hypothetical protein